MQKLSLANVIAILKTRRIFIDMDLSALYLHALDMSESNFTAAKLNGTILSECNLQNCQFTRADLSGADLQNANLKQINFLSANLIGARFSARPQLEGAIMPDGRQYNAEINLEDYVGVATAIHATILENEAGEIEILSGYPFQYGRYASTVEWLSKDDLDLILHICDLFLPEDTMLEIVDKVIQNDFSN
ncbi:hypothetical protein MASR2M15_18900 [Anaerolineales bacterium]